MDEHPDLANTPKMFHLNPITSSNNAIYTKYRINNHCKEHSRAFLNVPNRGFGEEKGHGECISIRGKCK